MESLSLLLTYCSSVKMSRPTLSSRECQSPVADVCSVPCCLINQQPKTRESALKHTHTNTHTHTHTLIHKKTVKVRGVTLESSGCAVEYVSVCYLNMSDVWLESGVCVCVCACVPVCVCVCVCFGVCIYMCESVRVRARAT